jgi:PGF-pre-PGF domain-containing protein
MYIKKKALIVLLVLSIPLFSGYGAANAATVGKPVLNAPDTGNFWVNYTWSAGANTDSFNVSVNGVWTNGTTLTYSNTQIGPHGWVNISVAGYNSASGQLSGFEYMSTRVQNNPITLTDIQSSYLLYEGQTLYISPGYTDSDGDKGKFATTARKGTFNSSSGVLSWKTKGGDNGVNNWQINVTDGYGSISQLRFTVTVKQNTGLNLAYTMGTSWVNYTWSPFPNADSYNVSINGIWSNGSSALFKNTTGSPHEWENISVAGYNEISGQLLDFGFISMNTQVSDDPITLTNVSDRYFLNEAGTLYISPGYTDADGDTGAFATNAACVTNAKCTFNPSTGVLSWTIGQEDSGTYNWYINVTDGYGSVSTQNFKVIIPLNYSINFIEPAIVNDTEQWVNARVGHVGKLIGVNATFKNTGEDSLVLMITEIYNNTRTKLPPSTLAKNQSFSYKNIFELNSTGVNGSLFNYTFEIEVMGFNGRESTFVYSNTTTISLQMIPIYKIKRANADIVFVSQGGNTPPIIYTLEANSSVNLTDVSIYDSFYPGKYYNISKLEANKPNSTNYTYQATTNDLSSKKCDEPYSCIINIATFTGRIESSGELISDTDYVEIPIGSISSPTSSSRGGGGGGGGGGGIPPSEDYNNIEQREIREMDILSRTASVYTFKSVDPVMVVSFESSTSENGIAVSVEILKNRSKHAGADAPGKLYKYFNVYVGTGGFSKKVSNGVVAYSVNNSWLDANGLAPEDIRLYKWQGSWVEKDTEIAERRTNQTYYASLVGNFSSFAIIGLKKPEVISVAPLMNDTSNESNATQSANSNSGLTVSLSLILLMLAIVGIVSGYYYFKKK